MGEMAPVMGEMGVSGWWDFCDGGVQSSRSGRCTGRRRDRMESTGGGLPRGSSEGGEWLAEYCCGIGGGGLGGGESGRAFVAAVLQLK